MSRLLLAAVMLLAALTARAEAPFVFTSAGGISLAAADARYLKITMTNLATSPDSGAGIFYGADPFTFPGLLIKGGTTDQNVAVVSPYFSVFASTNAEINSPDLNLANVTGTFIPFAFHMGANAAASSSAWNMATLTLSSDLAVTLTGGINGLNIGAFASFDGLNKRLGVGTSSPTVDVDVSRSVNATPSIRVVNGTSGTVASAQVYTENSSGNIMSMGITSAGFTPSQFQLAGEAQLLSTVDVALSLLGASSKFYVRGNIGSSTTGDLFHVKAGNPGSTEIVVNDVGTDADTRIESDTNDHVIFVDGGNNCLGIGTTTCAVTQTAFAFHYHAADANTSIIGGATSCTSTSITGTETAGTITATCSIGQIVAISTNPFASTGPRCLLSAADPDAAVAGMYFTKSSTSSWTATAAIGAAGAMELDYFCHD